MSSEREDQEMIQKRYARLITEVPKAGGYLGRDLFLHQGQWLPPDAILGAMLMQNNFKYRSSDIFLSSVPKSGTTWLKALMFSTLNRSNFDFCDHPLLRQGPQECFPTIDLYITEDSSITNLDVVPSPRLFATHLAHSLYPSVVTDPSFGCKFVYVCRDPKDVLISMWHFMQPLRPKEEPQISFYQAFESFCEGVWEYGSYWDHVLGFWKASIESPDKILFFKYEEMKRDPEVHVKKLADFMGVPFSFEEEESGVVEMIVKLCSFQNLKNLEINKTGVLHVKNWVVENRSFFRRGEVGDWKTHLTRDMRDRIDQITLDKFKGSGLTVGATPR